MTDDLTPEERDALKNLPRERMPSAGLEGRVVGALRERGVLARRHRRTIEITGGRVAGLIAASIAVVIGAYAIGLQHSGGRDVLTGVVAEQSRPIDADELENMPASKDVGRSDVTAPDTPTAGTKREVQVAPEEAPPTKQPKAPAREAPKDEGTLTFEAFEDMPGPDADTEKKRGSDIVVQEDAVTSKAREAADVPPPEAEKITEAEESPAAAAPVPESEPAAAPMAKMQSLSASPQERDQREKRALAFARTLSFLLNGTPVVVDLPDSVRITQDDLEQVIIIYTSDGPIRFRIAD